MKMEEVLGSKPRLRILKLLFDIGELNVSEIARRTGNSYKKTLEHLEILEREGILEHKNYGRIRLYRFNLASEKSRAVQKLIENWERASER